MSSPPPGVTVGVDLGGTGTRIVTLDRDGVVLHQVSHPTSASSAGAVSGLVSSIAAATAGRQLRGVGIGASGPVDSFGIIRNNDAAAAAVGEYACGAGRGSAGLLVVTLGTGVGVAALAGGRPFRGADGGHPEAGHIPVGGLPAPCYCGLPGCWEQLASRTALDRLTGRETDVLAAKARGGDLTAAQVFDTYGERVGTGLVTLLAIFRTDRIIVAGSAARFLDLFRHGLRRSLDRGPKYTPKPAMVAAELGDLSGAIGAAVMAREEPL